jgi:ABC-type glycerol-3-phosphate transport system substrate-binding protein
MTKRVVALFLAAMLAVAVVSAGVAVGARSFKTKVTIVQGDASNFHGKVKSKKAACKKKRKVKLQHKGVYDPPGTFHTIGTTKSNKRGNWRVATTPISGDAYRAKVTKKKLSGGRGTCKPKTSTAIIAS